MYISLIFSYISYKYSNIEISILYSNVEVPKNFIQIKKTQGMQEIKTEIKKLQEKYSSKDAATQKKLQKETMALFQEHGVNPLAGCLPIFVQMPVLIAMYHAIMRTEAIKSGSFLWFELGSTDPILPLIAGAATFAQQKIMMSG